MKLLTALILFAGLVLGVIALKTKGPDPIQAREIPLSLNHEPEQGHIVQAFQVEGMCCASCPENLRDAVTQLEGVTEVAVDPSTGLVEIETTPSLGADTLESALTFGDYVAKAVVNPAD